MPIAIEPKILLNMIVKNEGERIGRCLRSLRPWIDGAVIVDTGSTDDTEARTREELKGLPVMYVHGSFQDFAQSRNEALRSAQCSHLAQRVDFILLVDADMELVVEDLDWKSGVGLAGVADPACSFSIEQRAGIRYRNVRLIPRKRKAVYHGATHEYLKVDGAVWPLDGLHFIDHGDGANRPGKFKRDIRMLNEELHGGGSRALFYLAQSYRDDGQFEKAAALYAARAELDGFAEETWHARLSEARCYRAMGRIPEFVNTALRAWNDRPQRLEPLADMTRHYRDAGRHKTVMLLARGAVLAPTPGDTLFVETDAYGPAGSIAEDLSVSAFYVPGALDFGFAACDRLATGRDVPWARRDLARANLRHYAQVLPALRHTQLLPPDIPGYLPMNPSIVRRHGRYDIVVRMVNYTMAGRSYTLPPDGVVRTRWFFGTLSPDLDVEFWEEIRVELPEPAYEWVRGLEDMRLFPAGDRLHFVACNREGNPEGWCEMVSGRIVSDERGGIYVDNVRALSEQPPVSHQKNWTPLLDEGSGRDGILPSYGDAAHRCGLALDHLRGSSQAVPFWKGWLAISHEAIDADPGTRHYLHRFVIIDHDGEVDRVSRPFKLSAEPIEFVAGLAWSFDGLAVQVSYGRGDREAWIATVAMSVVSDMLGLEHEGGRA